LSVLDQKAFIGEDGFQNIDETDTGFCNITMMLVYMLYGNIETGHIFNRTDLEVSSTTLFVESPALFIKLCV